MRDFSASLKRVPVRDLRGRLARAVPITSLVPQGQPAHPNYLFTSGRQNRYNLAGTHCLYMSAEESTALDEFRRQFSGLKAAFQPVSLYHAEVDLARVLDLTDEATRKILGVSLKELEADWGGGLPSSLSQQLGEAARTCGFMAIRYQSVGATLAGRDGSNLVIYKSTVVAPSSVCIISDRDATSQRWP
ncbi:MAG TPA: RES family NAD+ phosphorylase [Candidatus Limnocylindria bacterium]|nr:RES family NAD+ phosphorylase [Candidatus Limnocylindria bacterium]